MPKKSFLVIIALLLTACGQGPSQSSSSTAESSGEQSSIPAPSSSESKPDQSGDASTDASSIPAQKHYVYFFDGEDILDYVEVEDGQCLPKPADPAKMDHTFEGWYIDNTFTALYDFSTPVTKDLSLFAHFKAIAYFNDYAEKYVPLYSPIELTSSIAEGKENPQLVLKAQGVDFASGITNGKVLFTGSLEELKVQSVLLDNKTMTIETKGVVGEGEGKIVLAKEATTSGVYITSNVKADPCHAKVDPYSYRFDTKENKVSFAVKLTGKTLSNPNKLSPEDFLASVTAQDHNLFRIDQTEKYSLFVDRIHDDFKGFDAHVNAAESLHEVADELKDNVFIHAAGELFSDGKPFDFHLAYEQPVVTGSIYLEPWSANGYKGKFDIKLAGCRVSDSLKSNKGKLLEDPFNKNILFSFPGGNTILDSIEFPSDNEIKGSFSLGILRSVTNLQATIHFNPIVLSEETTVQPIRGILTDDPLTPEPALAPITVGYDPSGTGTYSQSATGAYKGIKSVVQAYAVAEEEEDDLTKTISTATEIGKLGFGVATGDFTMSQNAVGNLLGYDALRNPSIVIMEGLAAIAEVLQRIETQIENIREKLDLIEAELADISQQTLLSNFLDAYNAWNAFSTDFYTPLVDEINVYTNSYFRSFYDIAVSSREGSATGDGTVKIYYDDQGELAFPDESLVLSIDGRSIDSSKTRIIKLPELVHALAGIRINGGHTYSDIENDILVDLIGGTTLSEEELADLMRTIRFNAMFSYFSSAEKADRFGNVFTNFCNALTGADTINVTPLDCFATLLDTIYNFGFEAEGDLNLAIIKLGDAYYCGRYIAGFADSVNRSQSSASKYAELNKRVRSELTSSRFFHSNDKNGNIYCYATSSYCKYTLDAYGIALALDWDGPAEFDYDVRMVRGESVSYNSGSYKKADFSSISEADAKLMGLKTKVYNTVNGTDFTFKEYLNAIGMIPDGKMKNTYGILLSLNGLIGEDDYDDIDDIEDLKFKQAKMHKVDCAKKTVSENSVKYTNDDDFKHYTAIKGKALDLEDISKTYNGIAALYWKDSSYDPTPHSFKMRLDRAAYTGICDDATTNPGYPICIYNYYVNFAPAK